MPAQRRYERGEGRHKHRWNNDEAGFRLEQGHPVGKCHSSIDQQSAERLLNDAVEERSAFAPPHDKPPRYFNVYRGVPYVAVPTQPGTSWHGYPWRGRLDPAVRAELQRRAECAGDLAAWRTWEKEHGK
jgi:hypothetical protein